MEPQVQYAKTSDGVNIAFASMGEGPPLVRLGVPGITHVQRELGMFPGFVPPLAKDFRVIWYDSLGTGLSDRDAIDFSMEAMIRDLEAVIERTGLQSFAALGITSAVSIAVSYATTFPDRVSHLILVNGATNFADIIDSPAVQATLALIDQDWTLFTETSARVLTGMDDPRLIEFFGEHIRACVEPETYRAVTEAVKTYDVSALLADVRSEKLVLHDNTIPLLPSVPGRSLPQAFRTPASWPLTT